MNGNNKNKKKQHTARLPYRDAMCRGMLRLLSRGVVVLLWFNNNNCCDNKKTIKMKKKLLILIIK